jgi:hypothetical protein
LPLTARRMSDTAPWWTPSADDAAYAFGQGAATLPR